MKTNRIQALSRIHGVELEFALKGYHYMADYYKGEHLHRATVTIFSADNSEMDIEEIQRVIWNYWQDGDTISVMDEKKDNIVVTYEVEIIEDE